MRAALRAVALAVAAPIATTEWTAKGTMRYLWATPVMEYADLFNEEQLCMFAQDVLLSWQTFLEAGEVDRVTSATDTAWTDTDTDRYNEKFFAWQQASPVPSRTQSPRYTPACARALVRLSSSTAGRTL